MDAYALEILSRTFLFRDIDPAGLEALLEGSDTRLRRFSRGAIIYSPEDFRRELGVVLRGSVTVTKGSLTVSELAQGDMFGAAALYTDEERYVSTLTARTSCEALFLSQEYVYGLIDTNRQVRENYLRYLAQRIRFLSAKVDALSAGTGGKKLSDFLIRGSGESGVVKVRSMTELASSLGIARASLYRELDKLSEAGIIEKSGKTITVLKPEALE